GVEGVREPPGDVADRLERLARALLERREHLDDPALNRVQRASWRLAEVGGQQDQGNGDEQRELCAPPANLLVVHEVRVSKVLLRAASVTSLRYQSEPSTGGAGCVNSCSNGGSPRILPTTSPSRPRHRSAATRPDARASASR